jgi:ABC-2 type transport system permease protein
MRAQTLLRSFRTAVWLGWQIESNWADPFLFAVYSIVKPLAAAGILVVMYSIVSNANFDSPVFAYLYLGNAFYQYVGTVMTGVSWAIIDDREHYRTLKYIYTAPVSIPWYLLGRGVVRFLMTTLSVAVTILFGVLFLHLKIDWAAVNWPMFLAGLLVGVLMLAMIGLLLAGFTLITARHSGAIGESVAGALFLFSGAIFPLEVLPAFLRPLGYVFPITYWLELLRRSLVGSVADAFPTLAGWSEAQLLAVLAVLTLVFGLLGLGGFRYFDRRARERGLIDMTTNY